MTTKINGNGNLTLENNRITGDFSNATLANRVMFQTSTVNSRTVLGLLPNGSGDGGNFVSYNTNAPANASTMGVYSTAGACTIDANKTGTGTYLPMTFYTGGAERMRIDAGGNISASSANASAGTSFNLTNTSTAAGSQAEVRVTQGAVASVLNCYNNTLSYIGTISNHPVAFLTNNTERMRIDTSGNVVVTNAGGGLGYGAGSGGTVTQATSKSTSVTLNKPTGQITMNNAALAAGASVQFTLANSLVAASDCISLSIVAASITQTSDYRLAWSITSGNVYIVLTNQSVSSLSQAVQINFAIIKGATA